MIGRKLVLGLAAVAFCFALAPASVHAKACPAKCKAEIKLCKTDGSGPFGGCKKLGLKGKDKKACIKACKTGIVAHCKAAANPTACSPSGAFLDEISY